VAVNYHYYFGDIDFQAPPKVWITVLSGYLPVRELADYLNLNLENIQMLNPSLRPPIFAGQKYIPKGYQLRLPLGEKQLLFSEHINRFSRDKQKPSISHTVRRGETASQIARRHGVKLHALIAANDLDARATIYVNQKIKIPQ
jgi:membrane-bound lytic murein transglycosylase D